MFERMFWKLEFRKELKRLTGLRGKVLNGVCEAEMETWIDLGEWKDWKPKDAVSESLSYWDD